jgi:hypothetical protein
MSHTVRITSPKIKGHAFSSKSWADGSPSWLPNHVVWTNVADEWARSPLAVSGASYDPSDEEAEAFSMACVIPGVSFELLLRLPLWYK